MNFLFNIQKIYQIQIGIKKNSDHRFNIENYANLIYDLEILVDHLQDYERTKLMDYFSDDSFQNLEDSQKNCYFQDRWWQFLSIEGQYKQYLYEFV